MKRKVPVPLDLKQIIGRSRWRLSVILYCSFLGSGTRNFSKFSGAAMGAGGRMNVSPEPEEEKPESSNVLKRAPYSKPPFTLRDIKKAIPPHCFKRSVIRSFSYVFYDLTVVFLLYYAATKCIPLLPQLLSYLAWPLYWICQGCIWAGVWVIAHECGHHAFSDYQWLDDAVGFILHSSLLVPYFSWKYSHRRHHSNLGSLEHDEANVPKTKSQIIWFAKNLNNPPGRFLSVVVGLTLGWPLYLIFNASGRKYDRFACHFYPYSPMYSDRERVQIYISDAGVLAVTYGLYRLVAAKGFAWVFCVYGGPLLVVNGFLVAVTFLQHIHPALPHYDSSEWDWLRGNLVTVDRDYGILNKVFHDVTTTHVAHHLFPTMPHYHAMEATKAIKPILGDYYQFDGTSIFKAMFREVKECIYVEPDEGSEDKGIYWYKNKL